MTSEPLCRMAEGVLPGTERLAEPPKHRAKLFNACTQDTAVEKFTVGALLGGYEAQRFKNKPTPLPLKSVDILCAGGDAAAAIARGQGSAKGVLLSRCLARLAVARLLSFISCPTN